jgi:hypothetical protein
VRLSFIVELSDEEPLQIACNLYMVRAIAQLTQKMKLCANCG